MLRSILLLMAAGFLGASAPPVLRSTSAPEREAPPPPATIAQMNWLIGTWSGTGIGDAPAHENWLRGSDSTLVGTFVQQTADGDIAFTEHMYITEQDDSLVLKLKHFNSDLTGWEEKAEMLTFPLSWIDQCVAKFGGVTFRCIAMDNPGLGLMITVKMKEGDELGFRLRRTDMAVAAQCADPWDISGQEACYADVLRQADAQKARYLAAAIENQTWVANTIAERRYLKEPDPLDRPDLSVVESIAASEAAFTAYRDAECGAVFAKVKGAATPLSKSLTCAIRLTEDRTYIIWRNWLAGTEVIPSILPEPQPVP